MGDQISLWGLHPWRYSELSWTRRCITLCGWPSFAWGGSGHTDSVNIWCLGASVIHDHVILTQTSTPKASPASPFILLKCQHYLSDSIHLSKRLAGFLSTLHTKLLLLHYLGGNEALNSFTWIFQSLQRSSSSSHTHTKNPSTESYREQQNLVLRLTWK